MKKSKFIILMIALIGNIQIACAQEGWFARCGIGLGSDVNTSNTGKFVAMEFGKDYKGLEVGLSFSYYSSSFDDYQIGHISYLFLFFPSSFTNSNFLYIISNLTPYNCHHFKKENAWTKKHKF